MAGGQAVIPFNPDAIVSTVLLIEPAEQRRCETASAQSLASLASHHGDTLNALQGLCGSRSIMRSKSTVCTWKVANELSLEVGDGRIGGHIKALLTRRSSRRETDMPHHEGYGCSVWHANLIFT